MWFCRCCCCRSPAMLHEMMQYDWFTFCRVWVFCSPDRGHWSRPPSASSTMQVSPRVPATGTVPSGSRQCQKTSMGVLHFLSRMWSGSARAGSQDLLAHHPQSFQKAVTSMRFSRCARMEKGPRMVRPRACSVRVRTNSTTRFATAMDSMSGQQSVEAAVLKENLGTPYRYSQICQRSSYF